MITGSHEVRGSIPLGSTNIRNKLGVLFGVPLFFVPLILAPAGLRICGSGETLNSGVETLKTRRTR
jgi:hypothetical protein